MSTNAVYVPPAKRAAAAAGTGPRTLVTPPSPAVYTHARAGPRLTLNTTSLARRTSPQSSISSTPYTPYSTSSRPSSRSSAYSDSDANSLFSAVSAASSATSFAASPIAKGGKENTMVMDQEQAGSAKVWVDTSRKEATNYLYQGGKTNVLTGGVMLGSPNAVKAPKARAGNGNGCYGTQRRTALFSALQPRLGLGVARA